MTDSVILRLEATQMLLNDCKARLGGCINILLNLPEGYELPNELEATTKELRDKVKTLYEDDIAKLITKVRVLP